MNENIYKFVDINRQEAQDAYEQYRVSAEQNVEKKVEVLKDLISVYPDYFTPYLELKECYLELNMIEASPKALHDGFSKAITMIVKDGKFPDELVWSEVNNRHIITIISEFANMLWNVGEYADAKAIYQDLLDANPRDEVGIKYLIKAIEDGFESIHDFHKEFLDKNSGELNSKKLQQWFKK